MAERFIERRRLLQISALAAASAAGAGAARAEDAGSGLFGYALPETPVDIAAVEAYLAPGVFGYDWVGPAGPRYPNGNHETGTVTVTARDAGPGVTYIIDGAIVFQDGQGANQSSERLVITQVFPALDGHVGVTVHTSFGAFHQGHVTGIDGGRLVIQLVGLSDALGVRAQTGFDFERRSDGFLVQGRARPSDDVAWVVAGDSTWVRQSG